MSAFIYSVGYTIVLVALGYVGGDQAIELIIETTLYIIALVLVT